MTSGAPTWASGSTIQDHDQIMKPYQDTIVHARAYAAELDPDMSLAFDQLNHKTTMVLRAYITAVYQEGHSYGEIERIQDAMKLYFEDAFGCWGSTWQFLPDQDEATEGSEERGEWIGNPVYDPAFLSLMQELKAQDQHDGHQTNRRSSIGYQDMAKLMSHLQKQETIKAVGVGRCLFFQTFAAIAFSLWLTFDEVLQIRRGHIRLLRMDSDKSPCFEVVVPFRRSNPVDRSQANVYEIFPRPDEPHACCVSSVLAWIQYIELTKGQRLQADDFLFPRLAKDDSIQLKKQLTVSEVSSRLNRFASEAGLLGHRYTRLDTHCLRRGGAQYRLLHPQDPWSISAVKWWGGWSERESAEKILEYLLSDSQYEASFGNMLSPHGSRTRGLADTARLRVEMLMIKERFESAIRSVARLETEVETLKLDNRDLRMDLKHDNLEYHRAVMQSKMELRQEIAGLGDMILSRLDKPAPTTSRRPSASDHSYQQRPATGRSYSQKQRRQSYHSEQQDQQPYYEDLDPEEQPEESTYVPRKRGERPQPDPPAERIPPILSWREAIQQWEEGDAENGLTVPLRDWSAAWRRRSGAHYIRKLIFKEYESFDRDADKMHAVYGANMTGVVSKFVKAICKRHRRQTNVTARRKRTRDRADSDSDDDVFAEEEEEDEKVKPSSVVPKINDGEFRPPVTLKFEGDTLRLPVVPKINHWTQAIQQWENGDPERGLMVPVRDWPLEWRKVDRVNKTYHNRKRIVDEYEACGRDEEEMRRIHGKKMDGAYSLLVSINNRRRKELKIKRAEASERDEDDDDDDEVWEDALEEAEVEVKEEEEEPTLIRKRKDTPSGDSEMDASKKIRPTRVQPRRTVRSTERYRDD
ncbi:hypothetical protein MVEG_01599 [Podila verticillata NRRL 6337]|nr:hypothetical protein MVEG_01599 [Podila verticillata NRRL 6337]